MADELEPGYWVDVKPEHDIPEIFRGDKPTRGLILDLDADGHAMVRVPRTIDPDGTQRDNEWLPFHVDDLVKADGPPEAPEAAIEREGDDE